MDLVDQRIINSMQSDFPIHSHPFAVAAAKLSIDESLLIQRLIELLENGYLTRFGPFFNAERMGGGFTLAALSVPKAEFDTIATLVNAQPEIAHNYARDHTLNMWFVIATEQKTEIQTVIHRLETLTGLTVFNLPKLAEYRLGFQLHIDSNGEIDTKPFEPTAPLMTTDDTLPDEIDRAIITATQAGLPLEPEPYRTVATAIGLDESHCLHRLQKMLNQGWIRRIGAATNHYRLGLKGNGMSVWHLPEKKIDTLGQQNGALDFVTHCYRRPRHLPTWPYNLFAMVHGADRESVEKKILAIAELLGDDNQGHLVLHSTQILKKTGLRFSQTS